MGIRNKFLDSEGDIILLPLEELCNMTAGDRGEFHPAL
jgi:hypothetical protein